MKYEGESNENLKSLYICKYKYLRFPFDSASYIVVQLRYRYSFDNCKVFMKFCRFPKLAAII